MAAGRVFKNAQDRFIAQLAAAVKIGNARLINFRIKHDNRSVIVNVCLQTPGRQPFANIQL